jgi:hypothetical protein
MAKKTDPPKKKTSSPVGPYKMTNSTAPKPKGGSQFLPKGIPAGTVAKGASLTEKVKIAKQLYKDNPSKVYYDAVKRAEKNLMDSKKK